MPLNNTEVQSAVARWRDCRFFGMCTAETLVIVQQITILVCLVHSIVNNYQLQWCPYLQQLPLSNERQLNTEIKALKRVFTLLDSIKEQMHEIFVENTPNFSKSKRILLLLPLNFLKIFSTPRIPSTCQNGYPWRGGGCCSLLLTLRLGGLRGGGVYSSSARYYSGGFPTLLEGKKTVFGFFSEKTWGVNAD